MLEALLDCSQATQCFNLDCHPICRVYPLWKLQHIPCNNNSKRASKVEYLLISSDSVFMSGT
uniref:Uncharacterized protein n=1 Tax=Rhizophora mucronata TaxID=61149 RepID=A0A2P2NJE4_RHIMU